MRETGGQGVSINIVLGDLDEFFLDRFSNYLNEKSNTFNVGVFTSKDSLHNYVNDKNNTIDILILTTSFIDESITKRNIPVIGIWSESSQNAIDGFTSFNKFQKASNLVESILMTYAEKTGCFESVVKGHKSVKIICIYSPVGGCGKTTLSIALSSAFIQNGANVFYLNWEKLNSTIGIIPHAPHGSLSEVFLALKTKGANVGLKILANRYQDPSSRIFFINALSVW